MTTTKPVEGTYGYGIKRVAVDVSNPPVVSPPKKKAPMKEKEKEQPGEINSDGRLHIFFLSKKYTYDINLSIFWLCC